MSFLSGIVGAISGGLGAIFNVGSSVISGINNVIDATGLTTLFSLVATLTNNINTLVSGLTLNIDNLISPIREVVTSVDTLADTIDGRIVQPIIAPIVDTVNEVRDLTRTIDRLVDDGISGIIQIPRALSDALGSIEARWDAATKLLAQSQARIVIEDLIPGIQQAIVPGLAALTEASLKFSAPGELNPDRIDKIDIPQTMLDKNMDKFLADIVKVYKNPTEWWHLIFWALSNGLVMFASFFASQISVLDAYKTKAQRANPTTKLSPADVLSFFVKGILSREDVLSELRSHGFNDARSKALLEGTEHIPAPGDLLDWWLKGLIHSDVLDRLLAKHGWNPPTIEAAKLSVIPIPSEGTLLDWTARGIITQQELNDQLRAKGYSRELIERTLRDALQNPQPNTMINNARNRRAAARGWFADAYLSPPPQEVNNAGKAYRIDQEEIEARWQSSFNVMPISTAIALFFRGELSRREVETVVEQNGYPIDMTDLLIKAQSPLLPARSIPTLVAKGELDVSSARAKLLERGYSIEDAELLLAPAVEALKNPTGAGLTEESKLTISQIRGAYNDGLIDEQQLRTLLAQAGASPDDIDFYVALDNYDIGKRIQKDEIDTIKAEVSLGSLSIEDAITQLFDLQLSEGEVVRIAATLKQAKRAAAKIPDLGMLKQFAKAGYIDEAQFLEGVRALGYSEPFDGMITALTFTPGEPNGDQPTEPATA